MVISSDVAAYRGIPSCMGLRASAYHEMPSMVDLFRPAWQPNGNRWRPGSPLALCRQGDAPAWRGHFAYHTVFDPPIFLNS